MLAEYVLKHAVRGACTCGSCIDAPLNPEQCQPEGHTADLVFFKVAQKEEPDSAAFRTLVQEEFPRWLDGEEHSYLEMGGDMGGQAVALVTMGLGHLLGVWQLLTPRNLMPFLPEDMQMEMAGRGMITIKAPKGEVLTNSA